MNRIIFNIILILGNGMSTVSTYIKGRIICLDVDLNVFVDLAKITWIFIILANRRTQFAFFLKCMIIYSIILMLGNGMSNVSTYIKCRIICLDVNLNVFVALAKITWINTNIFREL